MDYRKTNKKGFTPYYTGFTLIEMLVAIAVFFVSVTMVVGLFTSVLGSQRKSLAIQNVQENVRYLMAFMAKEIRMSVINSPDGRQSSLDITHPINGDISYSFSGSKIERNGQAINSEEVNISGWFFVEGKSGGDYEQPRVTIVMKVETTGGKSEEQTKIELQTTVSQRTLD